MSHARLSGLREVTDRTGDRLCALEGFSALLFFIFIFFCFSSHDPFHSLFSEEIP